MAPEKLLLYMKVLFCLVVVSTEGKRKRKNRRNDEQLEATTTMSPDFNMCNIEPPENIYCYCDVLLLDRAEEGNCWIFNDMSKNEEIWEGFASQTRIKRLTMHLRPDGTLKSVPTVAIMHLPSLKMFEVQYATIDIIRSYTFGNSSTLAKISLSRNAIKTLNRHAFMHLPSLETLSLSENQITEINRHVFADLPSLNKLSLDRNNITTLHDKAFQGLRNLEEMDLFSNQIQVITPETFKGLKSLKRLDLHKNRIEVIGDRTFRELLALKELDLEENSLKYIAPSGFQNLGHLQMLNLHDNKLLTLGAEVFVPSPSLLSLDLRANVLETLTPETFAPILSNLDNETMQLLIEGNNFRCDQRLSWMFALRNSTHSLTVQRSLDEALCYLEGATSLPPRLADLETVTPAYDMTTLGIGPVTRVLALHQSELPAPNQWRLQGADVECEKEEEPKEPPHRKRGGHMRSGNRKRANHKEKPQSDVVPDNTQYETEPGVSLLDNQPPPVQESREPGSHAHALSASLVMPLCLALVLFLLHH